MYIRCTYCMYSYWCMHYAIYLSHCCVCVLSSSTNCIGEADSLQFFLAVFGHSCVPYWGGWFAGRIEIARLVVITPRTAINYFSSWIANVCRLWVVSGGRKIERLKHLDTIQMVGGTFKALSRLHIFYSSRQSNPWMASRNYNYLMVQCHITSSDEARFELSDEIAPLKINR